MFLESLLILVVELLGIIIRGLLGAHVVYSTVIIVKEKTAHSDNKYKFIITFCPYSIPPYNIKGLIVRTTAR